MRLILESYLNCSCTGDLVILEEAEAVIDLILWTALLIITHYLGHRVNKYQMWPTTRGLSGVSSLHGLSKMVK